MGKYYDKKTLIKNLQKKAQSLGHSPLPKDMTDPSAEAYLCYFKRWDKAIKAAGLCEKSTTPDQMVSKTEDISINMGIKTKTSFSTPKDVLPCEHQMPAIDTAPSRRRYSKTIITQMLLDEFKRLGKKPTRKEIDENKDLPTVSTCLNYFETTRIGDVWNEILKES
ncbi:MAG: hypothetical protein RR614_06085 [Eubacterium sp.]